MVEMSELVLWFDEQNSRFWTFCQASQFYQMEQLKYKLILSEICEKLFHCQELYITVQKKFWDEKKSKMETNICPQWKRINEVLIPLESESLNETA